MNTGTLTTFGGVGSFFLGFGGSGFLTSSFLGGGGGSFTDTKFTFVSLFSFIFVPARAVAKTARKTMSECNIMLKMVPPADRPFLSDFLDSSNRI